MWVNVANSQYCEQYGPQCKQFGTYNANKSSTYKYVNSDFNISYEDGSGAVGDYATDTLSFAKTTLQNFQFGIGYTSSSTSGILGVGYTGIEVQVDRAMLQPYPNLPQALANQGSISTNAYSLWLNDLDANTGSILFGGVDTNKFSGTLATVPIIPVMGVRSEFIIALTGLGQNGNQGSIIANTNIGVLLDCGSSLTYLPNQITQNIFDAYNVNYNSQNQQGTVNCDLANQNGSIDFTFSGQTISVGLNELVVEDGSRNGEPVCIFGIAPAGDSTSVLGDTFLRSAYVVYDIDANQIGLAPTKFNVTSSNIMQISSGSSGIPSATPVPSPVTSVANIQTGIGRIGGTTVINGVTVTGSTGGAAAMKTPPPKAFGVAAAAGIGAAILAL